MSKLSPDPKAAAPAEEAALCQHELDARRENEIRARRKRDIEPQGEAGDDKAS